MRTVYFGLILLLCLTNNTSAYPAFNTPNSVDVHGNKCPLLSRGGLKCPTLCARTFDDCPSVISAPSCGNGQQLCSDGTCQDSCEGIENPCLCGFSADQVAQEYVACPTYDGRVTAPDFDPGLKQQQVELACGKKFDILPSNATIDTQFSVVPEWNDQATDDKLMWLQCPTPQNQTFTFHEPMFLAFYCILGGALLLITLWHFYKKLRESGVAIHRQFCEAVVSDAQNEKSSASSNGSEQDPLLFRGFKMDYFGFFLFYLVLLITAGWIVLLAVIVSDYYGVVDGTAFGVFLSSPTSSAIFIFVWHLAAIWLGVVTACQHRLRNYFRIECKLADANVIQVEERRADVIMMESNSKLLSRIRYYEGILKRFIRFDIVTTTTKIYTSKGETEKPYRYIEYHCTRYVQGEDDVYSPYAYYLGNTRAELLSVATGLSSKEAQARQSRIGENFVRVSVPSFPKALFEEFAAFFYLYQMMCLWVWFYFNYYPMGLVQMCVIIISALVKVIVRLKSEYKVKSLAEQQSSCLVKRDGEWSELDSRELVPGDLVGLSGHSQIVCDGVIVRGEVVVDESSLTGEAMPVRKFALKPDSVAYDKLSSGKPFTLFDGTTVLQTLGNEQKEAKSSAASSTSTDLKATLVGEKHNAFDGEPDTLMLVTATRTSTDKGKLIQRILYPTTYSFIFDEHLRAVILILLGWGGVAFALTIWLMGHDTTSWFYGLFIISQIMSPLLPAALVVGQSIAAERLRRIKIFCVDLPRIMVTGKVRVFCFDKTGTLTKEGLEFSSVQKIEQSTPGNATFLDAVNDMGKIDDLTQAAFASCHAVTSIKDQFIGNPVDVEQFRATDWEIVKSSEYDATNTYLDTLMSPYLVKQPGDEKATRKVVHVVKRNEFIHARQSMSVAILDPRTQHVHVFVKGSFERIKRISNQDSIPATYDKVTANWAKEGCYVLALAHKDLGPVENLKELDAMDRDAFESGCSLMSLIMFRNQLKPDTKDAITELKQGDTRTVMITGDNALNGIYIARQCGMVTSEARILLGDIEKDHLVWRDSNTEEVVENIDELLLSDKEEHEFAEKSMGDVVSKRTASLELAVTAAAFDYLVVTDKIRDYLFNIRIFARMTPNGKVEAVQLHMERAITAMCGDGGNDCGALRAAHVGLALSESEASIVSPFSSSDRSIFSCVRLLKHGRTALATSFSAYKFLIMYGESMAWLELFQFYFSVIVPQAVWIFIDSFIAVGLMFALTQSKPAKTLAACRPTAKLLGAHTLASLWGQILINFVFLVGLMGLLFRQSWYRCNEFDSRDIDTSLWWLLGDNYEAEVISISQLFQFINAAGVFNFGYRFRTSWWRNYVLVVLYLGFMAAVSVLVLADPNRFGCLFRINCGDPDVLVKMGYPRPSWHISEYNSPIGSNVLPHHFRWTLWGYCLANIFTVYIYEYFVVLGPIGQWVKRRWQRVKGDNKIALKL
ncbi:hypothetical protein H4219_000940 [Mycoemilia scoparia]|uniref:P-type ATPase A domain-containing protein n=1 Tax=Mycoemilia scoparia TaxID=417184 RepID=A0A9W8A2H6_9FUNG|nr:hypothetical protein H4219_000940 [Mycoemilia scoparia]